MAGSGHFVRRCRRAGPVDARPKLPRGARDSANDKECLLGPISPRPRHQSWEGTGTLTAPVPPVGNPGGLRKYKEFTAALRLELAAAGDDQKALRRVSKWMIQPRCKFCPRCDW